MENVQCKSNKILLFQVRRKKIERNFGENFAFKTLFLGFLKTKFQIYRF